MEYPVRKVVMTGGTSGIGLALIKKLIEKKVEILVLRRTTTSRAMDFPKHELLHVEYCSLEELKNYMPDEPDYDVFFHMGWRNTAREARNDIYEQMKNVEYSLNAVELAYRCGCHTFIGTGSQAEYGRSNEVLTPMTVCMPENAYGVAKLTANHVTRIQCKRYNIRHMWLRILSGYGLYDNVFSVLMKSILRGLSGESLLFSKGEQIWDFIYFDDIAEALYLMAKKGNGDVTYTISSGSARPFKEYATILCEKLGRIHDMELGAIPYGDNQIMYLAADNTDLQRDTGWKPRVSFEDGIERVINQFITQKDYFQRCLVTLNSEKF